MIEARLINLALNVLRAFVNESPHAELLLAADDVLTRIRAISKVKGAHRHGSHG